MNKEELIKELSLHRDTYTNDFGFGSGARAGLKLAIIKIGKLDELEKVVVPKFVADEFDYNKKPYWEVDESRDVSHILKSAFANEGKPSGFLDWVRENPEDYVMAVRNGYEVKKEKLYQVIIPTKDTGWNYYYLDYNGGINAGNDLKYVDSHTEDFIRSISDDLWQFAVEVVE